jgi:hypothetical protein
MTTMTISPRNIAIADSQLEELFAGVDDLIRRVADVENPDILKSRAKVHATMVMAKNAFDERVLAVHRGATAITDNARHTGDSEHFIDPSRQDLARQDLGVALLVGLGLGLVLPLRL